MGNSPVWLWALATSTTTGGCAWFRPGTAYKLAFGIDRSPIPWERHPEGERAVCDRREHWRLCADYDRLHLALPRQWRAGLIVADPRMTPITRNADLYLPPRPGTDLALLMGMLHVILRDGLDDREFIAKYTTGWVEAVAESAKQWNLGKAAEMTGVPPEAIEKAAQWMGKSERVIADARSRTGAPVERRGELPGGGQHHARAGPYRARRLRDRP